MSVKVEAVMGRSEAGSVRNLAQALVHQVFDITVKMDIFNAATADADEVVLMAERRTACPSGDGSCVPAWRTTGENRAVVFADGLAQVGRGSRADNGDWFTLVGTGGEPVTMPAGRTWIMIYPETAELVW